VDPDSKRRKTQQQYICVPMHILEAWIAQGWRIPNMDQSSGSSDTMDRQRSWYSDNLDNRCAWVSHTRDKQSSGSSDTREMDNESNLSTSWIAVRKGDVEGYDQDKESDMEWFDELSDVKQDKDKEELAKDEEKGMDLDDTQDREELAKDEEKGQVSP
jgi:hypothetical protein